MSTLYEIAIDYTKALDRFDEEEKQEELFERLNKIGDEFKEKVKNIAFLVTEMKEQCGSIEYEINRLKDRLNKKRKTIERLKEYVKGQMMYIGKEEVETPTHTIKIRRSQRTEVSENFIEWAIENQKERYLNKKISYTPNKEKIKEAIEKEELRSPYAKIVEQKNLIIN